MIRKAFLMKIKDGCEVEYRRRHEEVWPELLATLKTHGVSNYSIFHDQATNTLFAYAELESEELWRQIAGTEQCRRWWEHMKDLMFTNDDASPVAVPLDQVFHLN